MGRSPTIDPVDPTFLGELLALQGVPGFGPPTPVLPPLVPVPPERLAEAAEQAPLYRQLVAFVDWVGDSRKLTAKGNLTLADAQHLVTLLGTGDPVDEQVGDTVFTTRSSTELPVVDLVVGWARTSGFVVVRRGRVQRTKRAAQLTDDPRAAWERAFTGLLDLGILMHVYRHSRWLVPPWVADLDEAVEALLALLYAAWDAQPVDELTSLAWTVVEGAWDVGDLPRDDQERWCRLAARDVRAALALFAELGAVEFVEDTSAEPGVMLTDLGRNGVYELARAEGLDVPVAGALREASASELLHALAGEADHVARSEALAWLAEREPATAADDIVTALRATQPSMDELGVGLAMLAEIGEAAAPAVRALVDDEDLDDWVIEWLVDRGLLDPPAETVSATHARKTTARRRSRTARGRA